MDLQSIRENERKSHEELYSSEELYQEGSWLNKPIKTVLDILSLFEDYKELTTLFWRCLLWNILIRGSLLLGSLTRFQKVSGKMVSFAWWLTPK